MKKLVMAIVCGCSLMANAKDIDATVNMKLVSDKTETNTYANAISFYKRGLHEISNQSWVNVNYYIMSNAILYYYSSTNSLRNVIYYGYHELECKKEHVSDWPKSTTTEMAVQRVRRWESTVMHGTQSIVSVYEKYEYPTKLITTISTTVIKYETTTTTNTQSLSLEKETIEVEKRK